MDSLSLCVYSSLFNRNESVDVSQFAYFCYALKVCTSPMIVKHMIFSNEMLAVIAIVCLHTTLAISVVYTIAQYAHFLHRVLE